MALETADITFSEWLAANVDEIKSGGANFRGTMVTMNSEVVRYFMVWSIIFMTSWKTTDYFLRGTPEQTRGLLASTAVTLLAGWWGIPFGLVMTPFYLIRNLIGGERKTVASLIKFIESPEEVKKAQDANDYAVGKVLLAVLGVIVFLGVAMQGLAYLHKISGH